MSHFGIACKNRAQNDQFQSELNDARIGGASAGEAGDLAECRRPERRVRFREIGCVHDVEELRPELQPLMLPDCKFLRQVQVEIHQAGTDDRIAAGVAVLIERLQHIAGSVEPAL